MKSRVLYGSVGSANVEQAAPIIQNLRQHLSDYPFHRLFNIQETDLFFKLLAILAFTLVNENIKQICGKKSKKAKDRVTVYMCSKADGNNKIPIAVVGSSNNPVCFKTEPPGCIQLSRKKAWPNNYLFQKSITNVFKPKLVFNPQNRVAPIVDNAGNHKKLTIPEVIDIFPLHQLHSTPSIKTIRRILCEESLILEMNSTDFRNQKQVVSLMHPTFEHDLSVWVMSIWTRGIHLTDALIQEKARRIFLVQ